MIQQTKFFLYAAAFLVALSVAAYNFLYLRQVKNIRSKLGMFVPRPIYFALWLGVWFPVIACTVIVVFALITAFV